MRSLFFFIRMGTLPVFQHYFSNVRTVSLTARLDRVGGLKSVSLPTNITLSSDVDQDT